MSIYSGFQTGFCLIELMHHLLPVTIGAVWTFRCLYNLLTSLNVCENNTFTCQAEIWRWCSKWPIHGYDYYSSLCSAWDLQHFTGVLMVEWTDLFAQGIVHVPFRTNKIPEEPGPPSSPVRIKKKKWIPPLNVTISVCVFFFPILNLY